MEDAKTMIEALHNRGLSYMAIAENIGISKTYIYAVKNKPNSKLNYDALFKLTKLYNMANNKKVYNKNPDLEIFREWKKSSKENK